MDVDRPFWKQMEKQVQIGNAPDCFAADLVQMEKTEKETIDEDAAVDILAILVDGGADTISAFIQNFFKVIALNPRAMKNAQDGMHHVPSLKRDSLPLTYSTELDRIIGPDRLPTYGDQPNLLYTRCLIEELHRQVPIGANLPPYAPFTDNVFNGMTIPKGTVIFLSLPALNRDPALYEDPMRSNPSATLMTRWTHLPAQTRPIGASAIILYMCLGGGCVRGFMWRMRRCLSLLRGCFGRWRLRQSLVRHRTISTTSMLNFGPYKRIYFRKEIDFGLELC